MPFPDFDPIALQLGPFAIRWYALAYIGGLLGGWFYARRLVSQQALWGSTKAPTPVNIDDLIVWVAIGIVFGGRIGYVFFYNFDTYRNNLWEALAVWHGGMSFHGGFLGAAFALLLFAKKHKLPALALLDVAAIVAPIGLFLGRLANFINGELWGRAAPDFKYAVIFPFAGPLPRHPSQLYEAFGEGLVLFVIMSLAIHKLGFHRPGLLAGIFGIGYATARIICEFFREPDPQLGFLLGLEIPALQGGLTMGMILSLPMIVAGCLLIVFARRKPAL